jgi:hypothetical protein
MVVESQEEINQRMGQLENWIVSIKVKETDLIDASIKQYLRYLYMPNKSIKIEAVFLTNESKVKYQDY